MADQIHGSLEGMRSSCVPLTSVTSLMAVLLLAGCDSSKGNPVSTSSPSASASVAPRL